MYELVRKFRMFGATDDRDKVYALAGIAETVENAVGATVRISYAPNTEILDVFWDLIDTELRHPKSIIFLNHACGITKPHDFPSWMPLWYEADSYAKSGPRPFEELQISPQITYQASKHSQPSANMHKPTKSLQITATFLSNIYQIGEVFNRDLPEADHAAPLQRWAGMLDPSLAGLQYFHHTMLLLRRAQRVFAEEAEKGFRDFVQKKYLDKEQLIDKFFATLLASTSDEGTKYFTNPIADAKTAAKLRLLAGRQTEGTRHASDEVVHHVQNRIADVCHGRRLFRCGTGVHVNGKGVDANFGLCPSDTEVGDLVVLFPGAKTMHVIRMVERDEGGRDVFGLVGEVYVHDWMRGQLEGDDLTGGHLKGMELWLR